MQLVHILVCFEFACDEPLEKIKPLMSGELIFEIFNLVKLFQDCRNEESVGEESHKHESNEIDRLVHTSNITQQSNY